LISPFKFLETCAQKYYCRSRGGGNPALDNPVGMTQNVKANTVLSAALPELFMGWIPASAGTTSGLTRPMKDS